MGTVAAMESTVQEPAHTEECELEVLEIAVDSGASDSVSPRSIRQQFPIQESVGSSKGVRYTFATGDTVPNEGDRHIRGCAANSSTKNITIEVAHVHNTLCVVSKVRKDGHRMILDDEGSSFYLSATGECHVARVLM